MCAFRVCTGEGARATWLVQGAVQADFQHGAFLQLQAAVAEQRADYAYGGPDIWASATVAAKAAVGRVSFSTSAASLTFDLAFFAGNLQPVFAGDGDDGRNQRHPSVCGFDFVEAQQQAWMKSVAHRAHMTLDPAVAEKPEFIPPHHVLREQGFKPFSGLDPAGVELFFKPDQKGGSVGNGMGRNRQTRLLGAKG